MEADERTKETTDGVEVEDGNEDVPQEDDNSFEDTMVAKSQGIEEELTQKVSAPDEEETQEMSDENPRVVEEEGETEDVIETDKADSQPKNNGDKASDDDEAEGVESAKEGGSATDKDVTNEDEEAETQRSEEAEQLETDNEAVGEGEGEEMEVEESDNAEEESQEGDNEANTTGESGVVTRKRTLSQSELDEGPKRKWIRSGYGPDLERHDKYCWVCHKDGVQVHCKICPRSYHSRCMSLDYPNAKVGDGESPYPCPECIVVMNAETLEFRSDAMKQLSLDHLMSLLKNICLRMRLTPGSEPFIRPVDPNEAEDYFDYIVYPMDIDTLEKNIKKRLYGSTEGFLADAQWLVHNSIVFNSASSQYTLAAKRLLKVCKQELTEIETCPECYTNAHEKPDTWFVEACKRPHILVWAKLKGFPFWPAKAMKIKDNDVDVRFFGQHDRAWVSMKDCYLYSEEMPVAPPKKNGPLLSAIEELTAHVEKLKELHGEVVFSPVKTPIGPQLSTEQIRRMLPEYKPIEEPQLGNTTTTSSNSTINKSGGSSGSSSSSSSSSSNNNNNNNNNTSSNNKVSPPPPKKSPMTIRISSLKTNPTIVNISAVDNNTSSTSQPEGRVQTRLTRKSSAAAAQSNQPQSGNASESDQSNDEQKSASKEKETDQLTNQSTSVPEAKSETEEETTPSVPKGSEILANALGGALRRSTRGMSRSGDSNPGSSEATSQSLTPTLEKRLTRGAVKGGTQAEEGCEADSNEDQGSDEQPPDTVLEAMGLSKKTKDNPTPNQMSSIKSEVLDQDESEEGGMEQTAKSGNTNNLMEQLTSHTSIKPGYRFNLSKDISISAVDGAGGADSDDKASSGQQHTGLNGKGRPDVRRATFNPAQRLPPGAVIVNASGPGGNLRPRAPVNTNMVNGQQGVRTFTGPQLRQMVRNAKPLHVLQPQPMVTRIIQMNPNTTTRPKFMSNVTQMQPVVRAVQKTSKDSSLVVDSSLNTGQGPITLPGGTITVTPLTTMLGNVPVTAVQYDGDGNPQQVTVGIKAGPSTSNVINLQQQAGSPAMAKGPTPIRPAGTVSGATAQQRKQLMVSIPPSVNMHLQNLTKTMGDLVKSTVEQIALEIVEFCNNSQGKVENSRLQVEVERLQNKLKQEVTDVKHNNDIAMRELRMTMENDKKRALAELKRQMDLEKQKAIEETKKKQWCANCGREALFYCCWNTSYCGYDCQEEHWPTHMSSCSQSSNSR